ncbi:hypothetical protein [Rhizorhapis sp.]|uniref:hypothetical protein n=1 Tax=Rhizorhapis sp. TaxID=1968842 RepID=UPI002B49DAA3|nr:hypothetical protein [Rhizorhapis sp.]
MAAAGNASKAADRNNLDFILPPEGISFAPLQLMRLISNIAIQMIERLFLSRTTFKVRTQISECDIEGGRSRFGQHHPLSAVLEPPRRERKIERQYSGY